MPSLRVQGHIYADSSMQLRKLNEQAFPKFNAGLQAAGIPPLQPARIDIFQVNLGKLCNQTCKHCHVDAGPDRKEIMARETMQLCLDILAKNDIPTVDITGGAPELNPNFRWFVNELRKLGKHVMDRCNLTVILANKNYRDLPQFFAAHKVEVVSSLPHYTAVRTDRQRGEGVFEKSISALQLLNAAGYGKADSGLKLNLVYNPTGAILPGPQQELEADYKRELKGKYGIEFNNLYVITNMPISRFLDYLVSSGNYDEYMQQLIDAFNPAAVPGLMCRNTLSVSWDGYIYDCDFNQMLDIKVKGKSQHIAQFDYAELSRRSIVTDQHCYGCTAGLGSGCGGQTA
ncbi:MAG TPA: arsenosugar biosynthesis radical SAM (seleno)protein ArsS [Gammaproteobacteria bacterium]